MTFLVIAFVAACVTIPLALVFLVKLVTSFLDFLENGH